MLVLIVIILTFCHGLLESVWRQCFGTEGRALEGYLASESLGTVIPRNVILGRRLGWKLA